MQMFSSHDEGAAVLLALGWHAKSRNKRADVFRIMRWRFKCLDEIEIVKIHDLREMQQI
jgi:hypothetical protein